MGTLSSWSIIRDVGVPVDDALRHLHDPVVRVVAGWPRSVALMRRRSPGVGAAALGSAPGGGRAHTLLSAAPPSSSSGLNNARYPASTPAVERLALSADWLTVPAICQYLAANRCLLLMF